MDNLAILKNSPIGVATLDTADGTRLFVNQALVTMFGASTHAELLEGGIADTWVDPSRLAEA